MRSGEEFIEKIKKHKALINKVVFLYADVSEDRNDLRQEIISQAWKSFPSYRGDARFSTWLYRVATNVSFAFLRQRKKKIDFEVPNLQTHEHQNSESELLEIILKLLNPVEKSIVLLLIEGYKQPEIAEILGFTEVNTRTKIHRIRKKLKEHGIDKLTK